MIKKGRRNAIDIRKDILLLLKQNKELSLRKLESKVNTNPKTIKRQVEDLESLGFVKTVKYGSHPRNKKPYTACMIKEAGIRWISENNKHFKKL